MARVMGEQGCNYCNPVLRAEAEAGIITSCETDEGGQNCIRCHSRPRIRAMAYTIGTIGRSACETLGICGSAQGLMASPSGLERELIGPLTSSLVTFSLYGNYGKGHVTCDICDMGIFEAESFDLFEACQVFDYVPDVARAIGNVARVLKRKAVIFVHVSDERLLPGDEAASVVRYRTGGNAPYYEKDYRQPIVNLGREWFAGEWRKYGFSIQQVRWLDSATKKSLTWWVGTRA